LVELLHVRQRHLYRTHRRRTIGQIQRRCHRHRRRPADTHQQGFHVEAGRRAVALDGTLYFVEAMVRQHMQDANIVLDATPGTVLAFQVATQLVEDRRQLPVAKDVGVVHGGWPALQRVQVMSRVEDLLVLAIATRVRGDHLPALHKVHPFDVGFDRYRPEGGGAWHAVAVRVVADHLVLVSLGRLHHAGIEGIIRQ
jgi:hypothetical protein